jgi:hypothetical protein
MKPHLPITLGLALTFGFALRAQDTESKPEAAKPAPAEAADAAPKAEDKPAAKEEPALIGEATVDLGDFGSDEPLEREDLPNRGILNIPITHELMSNGMHWDQYNITFKTKRWGKYRVRFNYTLKNSTLGVQRVGCPSKCDGDWSGRY